MGRGCWRSSISDDGGGDHYYHYYRYHYTMHYYHYTHQSYWLQQGDRCGRPDVQGEAA